MLPRAEAQALLDLEEEVWSRHAAKLDVVVSSGDLGKKLFGFAVVQTLGEAVADRIKSHVDLMLAQKTITQAVLIDSKRAATRDVLAMKNLDMLPEKRQITCRYRDMPVPLKVCCVQDEISLTFACAIKGQAADAGDLEPVFAEEPPWCWGFESELDACFSLVLHVFTHGLHQLILLGLLPVVAFPRSSWWGRGQHLPLARWRSSCWGTPSRLGVGPRPSWRASLQGLMLQAPR